MSGRGPHAHCEPNEGHPGLARHSQSRQRPGPPRHDPARLALSTVSEGERTGTVGPRPHLSPWHASSSSRSGALSRLARHWRASSCVRRAERPPAKHLLTYSALALAFRAGCRLRIRGGGSADGHGIILHRRRRTLWAEQGPFGRLGGSCEKQRDAVGRASVGYVGDSDGWQDFACNDAMTWEYENAGPGNVALMAELPRQAVLVLGFGSSAESAASRSRV